MTLFLPLGFDSTVVRCLLHHIASHCCLLGIYYLCNSKYIVGFFHDFACNCIFLQSFGFFGVRWSLTVSISCDCLPPSKMLWFLIVLLFTGAAVGAHDDVATSVCEAEWFDAGASLADLDLYCQNWQGARIYQCLDLFSHSQRLARTFTCHGKQAIAFDIASNQQEDILARSGFYLALDLVLMLLELTFAYFLTLSFVFLCHTTIRLYLLNVAQHRLTRLCDHALICAGPPCSLFVPISQSVHQRYVFGLH